MPLVMADVFLGLQQENLGSDHMTLLGLSIVNQECLTQGFVRGFRNILNRLSVIVYEVANFF